MINSRAKGARGERAWRDVLRKHGYKATRGVQHCGKTEDGRPAPDVHSDCGHHWEVKFVQNLNLAKAMSQAEADCPEGKVPAVAHKKNGGQWLVTMSADNYFEMIGRPNK